MSINFTTLDNKILVQKIQKSTETTSGILLTPSRGVEKFVFGKVISVGPEVQNINIDSIVMFNPISGEEVNLFENKYTLLQYLDIYGTVSSISNNVITSIDSFKILHENDIIVKVTTVKKEVTHSSGIILTTNASVVEDRPTKGEVLYKGSNISTVDVGDIVEFGSIVGIDLITDNVDDVGVHYVLMEIDRVIGKYI